jgi:hypothetical protein
MFIEICWDMVKQLKHHRTTKGVYVTKFTFSAARDCTGHNGGGTLELFNPVRLTLG